MRRIFAAGGLTVLSGCSLLFTPSDLTRDGVSSPEAGGDDASLADGGPGDGGPTTRFCGAASHTFCDDFDREGPVASGWTGLDETGGTVTLTEAQARSSPSSLEIRHPARPVGAASTNALLKLDVFQTIGRAVFAFDVRLDLPAFDASSASVGIVCAFLRTSGQKRTGCVSVGRDETSFEGVGGGAFRFGEWIHVEIALTPAGTCVAKIDGATLSANVANEAEALDDAAFLGLGVHAYNAPVPAIVAYYDNVTVDTE